MSRFPHLRRRLDHWAPAHERAKTRAAERLDGPLGLAEATWLDEHLAGCPSCAATAASYEADRLALRSLRDEVPVPPRDLWARTAAAIEAEAASRGGAASDAGQRPRRDRRIPVGALSAFAVVAVVVGVSAVSGGLFNGTGGTAIVSPATPAPVATGSAPVVAGTPEVAIVAPSPIAVGAGDVQWLDKNADGTLALRAAPVDSVCPVDAAPDCATLDGSSNRTVTIAAPPKTIIGSPNQEQAIVVTDDGGGSQEVSVMALPTPLPTPEPTPAATVEPPVTPQPTATPAFTDDPAQTEPAPSGAAPSQTPETPPSEVPATPEPSASSEPPPTLTPEPTIAASLAIASDVRLVGEAAAFSADGSWFAFTAHPADGSAGPDVYVWHVGDESARRVTDDGRSYFASWFGDELLVSRPGEPSEDGTIRPETVAIDPADGSERSMGDLWRPVADPSGTHVVAWAGTLAAAPDGTTVVPGEGRLELRDWSADTGATATEGGVQLVDDAAMVDFDVHWDESGEWFATWIADATGSGVGRLSLLHLTDAGGVIEHPDGAPTDIPALAGFSLGQSRLAWATPPGQGGEGSRVQVVAWNDGGVGSVETSPGGDLIVVR